jgi:uncharacterized membrane protein YesL
VRLTLTHLWDNLPLAVLGQVVFDLLCLPAVFLALSGPPFLPALVMGALTIAPGWAALIALEAAMAKGGAATIRDMGKGFGRLYLRSVVLGLLFAFPVQMYLMTLPLLSLPAVPTVAWLGLAADGLGALFLSTLFIYVFPLLATHDLGLRDAFRNAAILASRHVMNTVGLLAMVVLIVAAALYLNSGVLLFFPAFWGMFVINNCRLVLADEVRDR